MPQTTQKTKSLHGILCAVLESVMHANHQSALKTLQTMQAMGFEHQGQPDMGKAQHLQFETEVMEAHGPASRTVKIPLLSMFSPKLIGIQQAEVRFTCHANITDQAEPVELLDTQALQRDFAEFAHVQISSERKDEASIEIEMKLSIAEIPMQAGYKQLMDNLSESHMRTHQPHTNKRKHDAQ